MKNSNTRYTVIGSSALQSKSEATIIEFPNLSVSQEVPTVSKVSLRAKFKSRLSSSHLIQGLRKGSIKGTAINRSKPWQNVLAGSFFFVFALACIYFGS